MSSLVCCFWWFLLGLLLGWLLNWLLNNGLKKGNDDSRGGANGGAGAARTAYSAPAAAPIATPTTAPVRTAGIDIVAAAAAGFSIKGEDDILIIEGIGPKIKELFNTAGFNTFEQVSKMSLAQMNDILEKGGPRFKLAKPGSWAEQAQLAANNEWLALKKLQDTLVAGVAVSPDHNA
jgi:predicted flap endonuclease-1-like 5' DNA nuclease